MLTEVMNGKSDLTIPQREMIALHVSSLNNCHYCVGSHKAVLATLGADDAKISAVEKGSGVDPHMAAILNFVGRLTMNPGAVTQRHIEALRGTDVAERAIEDVINVVSLFGYLNRLVDGFGIKGSPEAFSQSGAMVSQHGYGPVVDMLQKQLAA